VESHADFEHVKLPIAEGADYRYQIYEYDEDREISAEQTGAKDEYFFYMPFELAAFGGNQQALQDEFRSVLRSLLTSKTRILKKKGLITIGYRLEVFDDAAQQWKRIYGHSGMRPAFKAEGKLWSTTVYTSSPVVH
jgi:hypothetical protein